VLHCSRSEGKGFPDFGAPKSAVDHLVKEPEEIGKIDPEPAIQTSGVEASIHERVVPLDHHEPFALQTIHGTDCRRRQVYLIRFMTNAKHPANSPPPNIVVPNER
jgi:hypothetical protein